jgi:hypothetical protein
LIKIIYSDEKEKWYGVGRRVKTSDSLGGLHKVFGFLL